LDGGKNVYQISEIQKSNVSEEVRKAQKEMREV
jgi:hypothetical protein